MFYVKNKKKIKKYIDVFLNLLPENIFQREINNSSPLKNNSWIIKHIDQYKKKSTLFFFFLRNNKSIQL
jgi:hypothetical protein